MIVGAHVPTAGGLDRAPARGAAIGADAIQIFTRNQVQWFRAFERLLGLPTLVAIHLNDARSALGSRVDRHAPIGQGFLDLATFRRLVRDPRLRQVPMILETPGGLEAWAREIALLRHLVRTGRSAPSGSWRR